MKKILTFLFVVFTAFATTAQTKSSLIPVLKKEKATFSQVGIESTTTFHLNASSDEIEGLKKKAATMKTIKFEASKLKGNTYSCKLVVSNPAGAQYTQRIFGFLGFDKFTYEGAEKTLSELAVILTSLK